MDLAWELKRLRDIKVILMTIVTSVLGTIPKDLLKGMAKVEIRARAVAIQTTGFDYARMMI